MKRPIIFVLLNTVFSVCCLEWPNNGNEWGGRWFPYPPGQADNNPTVEYGSRSSLHDPKHGIQMGIVSSDCDDAKVNLTVDWDFSPINYTCFEDKRTYLPRYFINPIYTREHIPPKYSAAHKCMDTAIEYNEIIPTFGTHRPLWAKYGEYIFLPRQRWLHNLEHGAVTMLYHPCANKMEVNALKEIVKSCLYRYVITPYNLLPPERPLALVTWGHRLEMSVVDPKIAIDFIMKTALHGAEKTPRDGQYDVYLLQHAEIVSDINDKEICPFFKSMK